MNKFDKLLLWIIKILYLDPISKKNRIKGIMEYLNLLNLIKNKELKIID